MTWLILIAGVVFIMTSLIRWFEQTTDAVRMGEWNKTSLLVFMPFAVWLFPSRTAAGRPSPVPLHEPVRGFGSVPLQPKQSSDAPPPGTPKEFLEIPKIPPKKPSRAEVDPEKMEKLRQKMKDQGML